MYLAPGAQFCPNCQLQLSTYQPVQGYAHTVAAAPAESKKESLYRKVLIGIVIGLVGDHLLMRFQEKMYSWFEMDIYAWMKPVDWIISLAFYGLPLFVALILPKGNSLRALMIIGGAIWLLYRVGAMIYDQFFYNPYDYSYPPTF